MKRRRMKFSSRFMALLLCAAMMLTSVWNENLVVQAAPDTYYSEDVVTAGDTNLVPDAFAYDGGWTNSTFTSGAVESVDVDGSAGFKVSIAEGALGGSDWGHGFKYTGTYGGNATLTNGTSYLVSFKANSTVERKIQTGCDTGQQTTRETIQLQEGDNDISYVMNAGVDWGNFYFYCGLVDSSETDYGTHEITIWDFSIKEATITPVDGETVEETEGNLITNGTFAENADGWTIENNGFATVSKVPYRVVFDITQDVADYLTWMFWNFDAASLKSGSTYNVKMDVVSSVDRKLTVGFDDGGGRQEPKSVKANEKTTLEWNISYTGGTKFAIFLGSNILAPYAENQALGAHRISVSNVRFVETSGSTGGTESGGDTDTDTTTAATEAEKTELQTAITAAQEIETAGNEDGTYTEKSWTALTDAIDAAEAVLAKEEPTSSEVNTALANLNAAKEGLVEAAKAVEAAIGNLLVNGNFENGVTSWRQLGGPWTIEPYYVTCQIAQGSADWEGFLGQTVTLEANTDYVLAFDVKSTVARKLYAGFDGHATYSNLGVKDVPANTLTTVKYELNAASGVTGEFSLFLGNNIRNTEYTQADIPAHSITISNVRIVPKDLDGVTYDDPAPASYIAQLKTAYEEGATMVDAGQELLYSETSWKAYTDAIANAKTLLEKDGATVREVFDAIDALKEAKDGLVEEIPTDLEGTIIDFNDVEKNEYLDLYYGSSTGWTSATAEYTVDVSGNGVEVSASDLGSWNIYEIQLLVLKRIFEADASYLITFDIESDVDKHALVKATVPKEVAGTTEDADITVKEFDLKAGKEQTVAFVTTPTQKTTETKMVWGFGKVDGDTATTANIKVSNLRIWSPTAGDAEFIPNENLTIASEEDKAELKVLYEQEAVFVAQGRGDYTSTTWAAYISAVDAAKAVLDDEEATIAEVKAALKALQDAKKGLEELDSEEPTSVVVSEQQGQAKVGEDITLTYVADRGSFAFTSSYTLEINDKVVTNKSGIVFSENADGEKTITIPARLNTKAGVMKIEFAQKNCEFTPVYQTVYATDTTDEWTLVWQDEFDGYELNADNWDYQIGNGSAYGVAGWGNSEEQYYTDSSENSYVGDGTLNIIAKKDSTYTGSNYTSARIRTVKDVFDAEGKATTGEALQAATYGRIEAKIKMPAGDGIWPAFWMLPYDSEYGTWATSGELDIMEARGRLPETVCGTIHYGDVWPNNISKGGDYFFEDSTIEEYHIYAVEWDPNEITWFVDGEEYNSISNWYSTGGEEGNWPYPAPFDEEFYIVLNLAVGGTFDSSVASDAIEIDANGVDMNVDYVRWYQRDAEVYENWVIEEPEIPKDESEEAQNLLEEGNILYDSDFSDMNTTPYTEAGKWAIEPGAWNALLIPANGDGEATWTKFTDGGTNGLKVSVTDTGSQTYSVQMLQYFPVVKGYSYEISYVAYTDDISPKGDVSMKIGGDDDNSWKVYSAVYTDTLSATPTTYTHRFKMTEETDPTARFEFNLATSGGNLYITDVSVKVIDDIQENDGEDDSKEPLSDGNYVYNGEFKIGTDGLLYWHWSNEDSPEVVSVAKNAEGNRVANVTVGTEPVSMWQYGLQLLQSDTYELSFKVNSAEAQTVKVAMTDKEGNEYLVKEVPVQTGDNTVTEEFTMPAGEWGSYVDGILTITFEKSASIDGVILNCTTFENVDFDTVNIWPMVNGDFTDGTKGWTIWSEGAGWQSNTVNAAEQLEMQIAVGKDATFYCVGAKSPSIVLTKGVKYKVQFEYSLDSAKNYTLELAGEQRQITLPAGQNMTYVSDAFKGTGATNFALYFGPDEAAAYTFKLDNIVVFIDGESMDVPEGYKKPVTLLQVGKGDTRTGAVVSFTEDADWEAAENKEYYLDGNLIDSDLVDIDYSANTLTLDKSLFDEEGSYAFAVKAEGYTKTTAVALIVLDLNLLIGGNMNDASLWTIITEDANASAGVIENGVYTLNYTSGYTHYEWGGVWVNWSSMLEQKNISVKAGTDYVLKFTAASDLEGGRDIIVEYSGTNVTKTSTTVHVEEDNGMAVYEIVIPKENIATTDDFTVTFLLGPIGDNLTYTTNETSVALIAPHTLTIDNIFLGETADYVASVKKTLVSTIAECAELDGSDYKTAGWEELQKALEAGQSVVDKENATDAEVQAALLSINNALTELEEIPEGIWIEEIPEQEYIGTAIKVKPVVYDGKKLLTLNKDYTLSYKNNTNVGTGATVTVKGKGNYNGKYDITFEIVPKDITKTETIYGILKNGKVVTVKPAVTVELNGKNKKLSAKDYDLEYNYNFDTKNPDTYDANKTYIATVTGKGNYTGTIKYITKFVTAKTNLMKNAKIVLDYTKIDWTGEKLEPGVTVKVSNKPVDASWYTVRYSEDTVNAGKVTVTVEGDNEHLFGTKTATYTIKGKALNKLAKIEGVVNIPYEDTTDGQVQENLQVVFKDGTRTLDPAKDYTVTYSKNTKAGTATVIVTGKGEFEGKLTKKFTITKPSITEVACDAVAAYSKTGAKATNVVVKAGDKVLVEGQDYKLSYSNHKKVGATAKLTVQGIGNYTGKITTMTYTVIPADFAEAVVVQATDAAAGTKYSKLKVVVLDNGKKLGTKEYTVSYSVDDVEITDWNSTVEAGKTVKVTVTAKEGNYMEGSQATGYLYVATTNISKAKVTFNNKIYFESEGEEVTLDRSDITVTMKIDGKTKTLKLGKDFEILEDTYKNNTKKGTASVTIKGLKDFYGTKVIKFKIQQKNVADNWFENVLSTLQNLF